MPRRGRRAKRRAAGEADLKAWARVFFCGTDWLHELQPYGIKGAEYGADPDDPRFRKLAAAAWQRYGSEFIVKYGGWDILKCWAFREFGLPPCHEQHHSDDRVA